MASLIESVMRDKEDLDKWEAIANMLGLKNHREDKAIYLSTDEVSNYPMLVIDEDNKVSIDDIHVDDEHILYLLRQLKDMKDGTQ